MPAPRNGIYTHNSSIKSDLNSYHPLSSIYHDPFPRYFLDQPIPNPNSDHVQVSHSSQVEEKESEDSFDLSSLFQNPLCQDYVIQSLVDFEPSNLSDESNETYLLNQSKFLNNHHHDDSESIIVCDDVFPSTPFGISVLQEKIVSKYIDIESDSYQEVVRFETSSSPHYPLCSIVCNSSTCEEDTPCSSSSLSNELDFELTQDSEVIHDEEKYVNSDRISGVRGFHLDSSDLVKISSGIWPCTMHNQIQS